ncbi:unnamed protein product [Cyclocybe aegerita]|uniref:Cytochrome P450 n=1 Tax=Cyclocybe aegerita TaxID=1973307 RepID=A0A8S0VUA5_CYCAE|nr:unnamed protein product [Cyclocybe aegerita]
MRRTELFGASSSLVADGRTYNPGVLVPLFGGLTLLYLISLWLQSRRSKLQHYPPGPTPKNWIAGNSPDIPSYKPWLKYTEWSKKYGDIMHIRVYNQHLIILNSVAVATDLLDKRARIYSDRPRSIMLDLMGWNFATGFKPYGDSWRRHRRLHQQAFKADSIAVYHPIQMRKVNEMLYGLLTAPEDFSGLYKSVSAAIVMSIMYNYDIKPQHDPYVQVAEKAMQSLSDPAFVSLVEAIPPLRYLPAWFPWAGFQKLAQETKEATDTMLEIPTEFVRRRVEEGYDNSCLMTDLLRYCKTTEDDIALKETAATGYLAGADTTSSALGTFFYAMALHPRFQKKAQEEIDMITGGDRLPIWEDRPSMPYLEAIFREVMRWKAITPLGLSHSTTEDDVYQGYYIPKGATVVPNIWAMTHNEQIYQNPEEFDPGRFLTSYGHLTSDDVGYTFGFGRRICVGRHLASSTFWYAIANILAVFEIDRKKDANGNYLPLEVDYSNTLVSHAQPFKCSITPRSQSISQIILQEHAAAAKR